MPEEQKPSEAKPRREKDKSDLVDEAMKRLGMASYEAWDLTVDELTAKLKES